MGPVVGGGGGGGGPHPPPPRAGARGAPPAPGAGRAGPSTQILESARREAESVISEATAKATRQRGEVERELTTLVRRRDSVQAQLQNVREMLATMTGASTGAEDDEPAEEPQGQA